MRGTDISPHPGESRKSNLPQSEPLDIDGVYKLELTALDLVLMNRNPKEPHCSWQVFGRI